MNEDTDRRQESPGRILHVYVCGDTANEIELAALDEARAFFGSDRRLAVIPAYRIHATASSTILEIRKSGKRYVAGIDVQTIEGEQS